MLSSPVEISVKTTRSALHANWLSAQCELSEANIFQGVYCWYGMYSVGTVETKCEVTYVLSYSVLCLVGSLI